MNVQIAYHGLKSSPTIDAVIRDKTQKLDKFFDGHFDVQWTCSTGKQGHSAHATVLANGFKVDASNTDEDFYKTVDNVVGKIDRQLKRKKDVAKNHIHRRNKGSLKEQFNET